MRLPGRMCLSPRRSASARQATIHTYTYYVVAMALIVCVTGHMPRYRKRLLGPAKRALSPQEGDLPLHEIAPLYAMQVCEPAMAACQLPCEAGVSQELPQARQPWRRPAGLVAYDLRMRCSEPIRPAGQMSFARRTMALCRRDCRKCCRVAGSFAGTVADPSAPSPQRIRVCSIGASQ